MLRTIFLISSLCLYALCVAQSSKTPASANTKQLQFDPSSFKGSDSLLSIPPKEKPVAKKESIYITNEKYFEMFSPPEEMPDFGTEPMENWIERTMAYPEKALHEGIEGRVIAQCWVEKDGSVSHTQIVRGVEASLDSEAWRVVSLMKFAHPAMQRKQPVRVSYTIPVNFKLPVSFYDTLPKRDNIMFSCPEPIPAGFDTIDNFLSKNIHYPQSAIKKSVEGRVIISFWINKKGGTFGHKILKSINYDLDQEALRVCRLIKFKEPAYNSKGKAVYSYITLPFNFKLDREKVKKKVGKIKKIIGKDTNE